MFKLIFVGIWGCLVAIGAGYVIQKMNAPPSQTVASKATAKVDSRRTPELNIPKVKDGAITGYVVAEFGYDINVSALASAHLPPDPIVVDEALRYVYNDPATDFTDMKKVDLTAMTDEIKKKVNARVGADVVVDVTIQELNMLPKEGAEKPI